MTAPSNASRQSCESQPAALELVWGNWGGRGGGTLCQQDLVSEATAWAEIRVSQHWLETMTALALLVISFSPPSS